MSLTRIFKQPKPQLTVRYSNAVLEDPKNKIKGEEVILEDLFSPLPIVPQAGNYVEKHQHL